MKNIEKQNINKPIGTIEQETTQKSMSEELKATLLGITWTTLLKAELKSAIAKGHITEEEIAKTVESEIKKARGMAI